MRPENAASLRVLAKLGFREEGLFRRYLDVDGAVARPPLLRDDCRGAADRRARRAGLVTEGRADVGLTRIAGHRPERPVSAARRDPGARRRAEYREQRVTPVAVRPCP